MNRVHPHGAVHEEETMIVLSRRVLRRVGLLLAVAPLLALLAGCSPRPAVSLDAGWSFLRADAPGAEAPGFNDSLWSVVDLPHTWNALDGQDHGPAYYRGIGWYRKHLVLGTNYTGRQLFVTFDGANITASLYVNGALVGEHRGGFAAFTFNVTPYVVIGQDNVLAVKVDNLVTSGGPPLSGDFNFNGGLYRSARLTSTQPVHISLTDFSSPGVYAEQTSVTDASANLQVRVKLRNDTLPTVNATVRVEVFDADGNSVQVSELPKTLPGLADSESVHPLTIASPHLWNGRQDPYLYRVVARLSVNQALQDEVRQPLGLRYFHVDPDNGFSLNGQYLDLHGVAFHQDRLDKGWAISDADRAEDVSLIKEVGATFVRLAHYQHGQGTYDQLDQAGIVAWSEIPYVNSTGNAAFSDNAKQQLKELIRQNYNHPSIAFWGMFNEIGPSSSAQALVTDLVQLAHTEDPTRLTTAASHQFQDGAGINFIPDVIGVNEYRGWYNGTYNDIAGWADTYHAAHPATAFAVSEYGAGAGITQHEDNPAPPNPGGLWHPEEYQNLFHEAYWAQLSPRPFIWGKLVWNMFDFAVDSRNEGDTPGRNDKGLVTYDRKTRKDAFFWYKSNWSAEPVVYITSRRFTPRSSPTTDVKVYSNFPSVELFVNAVSLGPVLSTNHVFTWPAVALAPGANTIEAVGSDGTTTQTDTATWDVIGR